MEGGQLPAWPRRHTGRGEGGFVGASLPCQRCPEVVVTGDCPAETPGGGPAAPTHPREPPSEELCPAEHPWGGNPSRPRPRKRQTPRAHGRAHTCTSVPAPSAPIPGGRPRAGAAGSGPSRPAAFPCAVIYLTVLLFKALTHLAQPQPAAPTPLRRCLLPAHPALCSPRSPGTEEGTGETPGGRGAGGGLAPGLCPLLAPPCVLGDLESLSVFASRAKLQSQTASFRGFIPKDRLLPQMPDPGLAEEV